MMESQVFEYCFDICSWFWAVASNSSAIIDWDQFEFIHFATKLCRPKKVMDS
jgi:hypothetical protein